eukprot:gnl/MRDRNA2_/MRDRNA2_26633_c0_seq1.p1 gnl/MRDRNA2_/MRDRNA2_26633_c0~~gnl/MRDRNA2_/MRDRNA2_26633_c0_seq1.p1  ORF type:complete len:229 (-),score=11.86 gnl/MRDRNA2_/MRDRNA2_26633_c0_seq1:324-920(-)
MPGEAPKLPLKVLLLACIPGLFIQLLVAHFVMGALEPFTKPGFSLFQFKTSPIDSLSGNCLKEYTTLHIYWLVIIAAWVTNVLLQILVATRPGVSVALVRVLPLGLYVPMLYLWHRGVLLVLYPKTEDLKECEHLHNVAWWLWVFVPLFFVSLFLSAMCAFLFVVVRPKYRAGAEAREICEGLVVTPAIEEVCYEKLP